MRERGVGSIAWRGLLAFVLCLAAAPPVSVASGAHRYEPTLASLDRHPIPRWWQDAKFGIFIHWGPYSVPAFAVPHSPIPFVLAEWYWQNQELPGSPAYLYHLRTYGPNLVYDDFIPRFTAARWDPASWIRLFKAAGARYFMLTVKHHDGVALWPTRTTHRNTFDLGPHRDLVGPLFAAARRIGGIKPGVYYSIPEWFNPAPRPPDAYNAVGQPDATAVSMIAFNNFFPARNAYTELPVPYTGYIPISDYAAGDVRPQLRELIRRYHPWEIWCDIGGAESYFHSNEVIADYYNWTRKTNPGGVVVNSRCGDSRTHRDFETVEEGATYKFGKQDLHARTETVHTISGSWGYNAQETDADYSSVADLVHELVTVVAENSNLVLNIGPRPDGTIPQVMQERLLGIGKWLRINGEAIYGTRPWTQSSDGDLRFTVGRYGTFYIIALSWPGKQLVTSAPVPLGRRARITLLGSSNRPLAYHRNGTTLTVRMPADGDEHAATRSRDAFVLRIAG